MKLRELTHVALLVLFALSSVACSSTSAVKPPPRTAETPLVPDSKVCCSECTCDYFFDVLPPGGDGICDNKVVRQGKSEFCAHHKGKHTAIRPSQYVFSEASWELTANMLAGHRLKVECNYSEGQALFVVLYQEHHSGNLERGRAAVWTDALEAVRKHIPSLGVGQKSGSEFELAASKRGQQFWVLFRKAGGVDTGLVRPVKCERLVPKDGFDAAFGIGFTAGQVGDIRVDVRQY